MCFNIDCLVSVEIKLWEWTVPWKEFPKFTAWFDAPRLQRRAWLTF